MSVYRLPAAVLFTLAIGIGSNPAGIVLAGSGIVQAAGCCTVHNGIRSNPAGIVLAGSGSVQAAAGNTMV